MCISDHVASSQASDDWSPSHSGENPNSSPSTNKTCIIWAMTSSLTSSPSFTFPEPLCLLAILWTYCSLYLEPYSPFLPIFQGLFLCLISISTEVWPPQRGLPWPSSTSPVPTSAQLSPSPLLTTRTISCLEPVSPSREGSKGIISCCTST